MPAVGSIAKDKKMKAHLRKMVKKTEAVKDKAGKIYRIFYQNDITGSAVLLNKTFIEEYLDDIDIQINNYEAYYKKYGDIDPNLFKDFNRSIENIEKRIRGLILDCILHIGYFAKDIDEFDKHFERELESIRHNNNAVKAAKELAKIGKELEYMDKRYKIS